MFCSNCGYEATPGMRYCNRCGGNLLTTPHSDESPRPVVNVGFAAFFLAIATVAIVLGGLGILTNFARALMMPTPWNLGQVNVEHNLPVVIPMIVLGSVTILATVFFMMRIFSRLMHLPQDNQPAKQKPQSPLEWRSAQQIQPAPPAISTVTEHTTRNFDPVPMKERPHHQ